MRRELMRERARGINRADGTGLTRLEFFSHDLTPELALEIQPGIKRRVLV
jgi:hypothetical protein